VPALGRVPRKGSSNTRLSWGGTVASLPQIRRGQRELRRGDEGRELVGPAQVGLEVLA
jgi:hypothetical protein